MFNNIKKFKINNDLDLLTITSLKFFKKNVTNENIFLIFENYDFKNNTKLLTHYIKKQDLLNFYTVYENIFFNISIKELFFKKTLVTNYLYINFNIKNKQIYITLYKNNFKKTNSTFTTGIILSLFNLKNSNKKNTSSLLLTLKFFKNKLYILQKKNYNFIVTICGINKNIIKLKNWFINSRIYKNILLISWKLSQSYVYVKKKKYSSIKKNLKKRLLRVNGF